MPSKSIQGNKCGMNTREAKKIDFPYETVIEAVLLLIGFCVNVTPPGVAFDVVSRQSLTLSHHNLRYLQAAA